MNLEKAFDNPLYRFFLESGHADAFVNGKVWISTLEECRRHEEAKGDSGEGTIRYESGHIEGDWDDIDLQMVTSRMGFRIMPGVKGAGMHDCSGIPQPLNAFVLCTTKSSDNGLKKRFGNHYVEISNPVAVYNAISEEMNKRFQNVRSIFGPVKYDARIIIGTGKLDAPSIAFIKPPEYQEEQEVRMAWGTSERAAIQPFLLSVPEISKFFRKIT